MELEYIVGQQGAKWQSIETWPTFDYALADFKYSEKVSPEEKTYLAVIVSREVLELGAEELLLPKIESDFIDPSKVSLGKHVLVVEGGWDAPYGDYQTIEVFDSFEEYIEEVEELENRNPKSPLFAQSLSLEI